MKFYCRESGCIGNGEHIPITYASLNKKSGETNTPLQPICLSADHYFDGNEMPSNAINTNNSDNKPSRIAGLVLCRRTGFVVAHQRGTLMDIEII